MEGWIDIHAHILPQVDDGAADWEDSAGLLEAAARLGTLSRLRILTENLVWI